MREVDRFPINLRQRMPGVFILGAEPQPGTVTGRNLRGEKIPLDRYLRGRRLHPERLSYDTGVPKFYYNTGT